MTGGEVCVDESGLKLIKSVKIDDFDDFGSIFSLGLIYTCFGWGKCVKRHWLFAVKFDEMSENSTF